MALKLSSKTFNIVAYLYLAAFVMGVIFFTITPIMFTALVLMAFLFVLPDDFFGLLAIIGLTMLFERFFTLSPLVVGQEIYKIYPLDIMILATALAWFWRWRRQEKPARLFFDWPEKILLAFIILGAVGFIRSLVNINSEFEANFSTFKNYTVYPLLYFLTAYAVSNVAKFKKALNFILLNGLLIIAFILIGLGRGQGLWTEFTPLSTAGTRLLAGTHAFYLVLTSLIAVSLLIFRRFWHNFPAWAVIWIWLFGVAGSLMRHLWLALILGLAAIWTLSPQKNKKIIISYIAKNGLIIATAILLAILFINLSSGQWDFFGPLVSWKDRFVSIFNSSGDTSVEWRLAFWQAAEKLWLTNPLLGVGFGRKIPLEMTDWQTFEEIRNIHNSPLAILIQTGIAGFAAFVAFTFSVILKSWRRLRQNQDLLPYGIGLIAGVFAFLAASFFQPYLETNLTSIFLWIWLGLLRAGGRASEKL